MSNRKLLILGTRGIPGNHGGFETFAERLALYLVDRGWEVTVYCQANGEKLSYKKWQGVNLVRIPCANKNALWSIVFDFKSTLHALQQEGVILVLGYNTAVFSCLYRLKKRINITNMDGMEWWRDKWNALEKAWLYFNERCGVWFSNHLIADHPEIKNYLLKTGVKSAKITVIPYGTDAVVKPDSELLKEYDLTPGEYVLVIARPEPENSILEIVSAFSQQKRGIKLVVLGRYLPDKLDYHKQVLNIASEEVIFPGAVYDKDLVNALRYYALLYIHGHKVGGTNPSLVEALAAGSPILAHDNPFNSWVAGANSYYFKDETDCQQKLTKLLADRVELEKMKTASLERYLQEFSDNCDLKAYEELFLSQMHKGSTVKKTVKPEII